MRLPDDVRTLIRTQDPTRPRLTWYGPAPGERIELSGRVLDNWAAKVGNLLQEELDLGPGRAVRLQLPPGHWRAMYWALGAWSIGATLDVAPDAAAGGVDVLVSASRQPTVGVGDHGIQLIAVSLEPLARRAAGPLNPGDIDEAQQLSSYGDVLEAWDRPAPGAPALRGPEGLSSFDALIAPVPNRARLLLPAADQGGVVLRAALSAWAADGSVVITPDLPESELERLAGVEGAVVADPARLPG